MNRAVDPRAAVGFGRVAADYERFRPDYPPEAVAFVVDRLGIGAGSRVADVGAGTGKFTRQLLDSGAAVVAVEPVAAMRDLFRSVLPGVEVLDGTGESIPLPDGSVDAVTAAQAAHWFEPALALAELARVLRPGGGLALLWNLRAPSGWAAELATLRDELTGGKAAYPGDDFEAALADDPRFTPLETQRFEASITATRTDVLAENRTHSYVAALPDARRQAVNDEIERFLDRHPETAGREAFAFDRPCEVKWCRRRPA